MEQVKMLDPKPALQEILKSLESVQATVLKTKNPRIVKDYEVVKSILSHELVPGNIHALLGTCDAIWHKLRENNGMRDANLVAAFGRYAMAADFLETDPIRMEQALSNSNGPDFAHELEQQTDSPDQPEPRYVSLSWEHLSRVAQDYFQEIHGEAAKRAFPADLLIHAE